jgi:glycosyltransferase involved in cell wall biosynthesis
MKKIAIISSSYHPNIWNGQGRSTFSIAYGLASKGHDVSVFTFTNNRSTYKQHDGQVTIYHVGGIVDRTNKVNSLPFVDIPIWNEKLLPLLLCETWDVIILNNWHGAEAAIKYHDAKIIGIVPFLYSFTGWLKPLGVGLEYDIKVREANFITRSDILVAHTARFGRKLAEYADKEVFVIPNSYLDLSNSDNSPMETTPNKVVVVGRINRERSIERLIRIMPKFPNMNLVLASPESSVGYYANIMKLGKRLDVDHRITFKGWLPTKDVRDLYRTSCCAVVPSQFEPYGYGALDPMSLGVPLIVSEWSCLDEYTGTDIATGFSTIEELQEQMDVCLSGKIDRKLNSLAMQARINEQFTEQIITTQLESLL